MQLKHVVLPAPLGPMSPTISNSSTLRLTSSRACRPPKRIDSCSASRTGIDTLRPRASRQIELEALALEPPPDRRSDRAQALGLEDQGDDRQHARQRRDDVDGVVPEEADRRAPVGQVLAPEAVQEGEHDDAAPTAETADHSQDQEGKGDADERLAT